MMISIQTPEMAFKRETSVLFFLIISINCVSVLRVDIPNPKLMVNISDGEVIARWNHPEGAPSNSKYNVEMKKHGGEYYMVNTCTGITGTFCDLTSLIHDYRAGYTVRVQLVGGDDMSWTHNKFVPNDSEYEVLPPSFTLKATSSSLTVYVHEKPILKKLYLYWVTYTIYLEEKGEHSKNTTAYMKDDFGGQGQRTKVFSSLHWGKEYCVSIKFEGAGAVRPSRVSEKRCLLLPEQEWFIMAVSSLSVMGVLVAVAIMSAILLCYLKRPEKTPVALKSPLSGWRPLSVGEGTMEVVTDKGWFLSSYRTELKNFVKTPAEDVTVMEDSEEEDRRTSMDSGVSTETNSATDNGGKTPTRQEDSGCGSMGGPESSSSSQTDYPLQDDPTDTDSVRKREDSGVGMGCRLHSSSMNLDGQDSGPLKESVPGGSYRSQITSAVQIHICDEEDTFKQILPESVLAEVVTGYRAGPQSCICSGAGQCTWCHKQIHNESEVIKQYRALCIQNRLLGSKCSLEDSYNGEVTFAGYAKKAQIDTVMIDDLDTKFLHIGETFPLLTSLSPLSTINSGQDFNMNNVSLSLCDVQLTTD
ncbi:interleukin-10 receptor subunit alpha [Acanthochromis polyacanthus]|uniref:interleukin-10 receptor subunit alpha n=1 Tax=Acanthochromis polyacanthus TaxID=80966 RepID=UPI0022344AC7|nr:interleukin-10 receptor subunit alpha [Acanthochromis polyacanthus]XP_051814039.1 interleukin-10 receptor subunit alpha [Acanthochromis polyacanthus]